ncbi:2-dehydro-3-deoxygalactonokinase [Sphingorhabdus contaminans]|uniref:2-dehydro-3-deoxygalactonokinase n=1 Tax=Sphingorhabdus contaminans TaxID=1343899 RepID=A0A553WK48_9SPHN|nr:2-dehydro-3-deoxygalactonokinase [Sphingorhabdus contaminans]TSB05031.1 2-dehydro-3-deoxygalactonokinase [Sphingorhabdus contaminans]
MWGQQRYIAVDWGTTNRRAWLIDPTHGKLESYADNQGLLSVPKGGFEVSASDLRSRFGDYPMLLAGMVGSDKGWHQVPYKSCPTDLADLAKGIFWMQGGSIGIVPGVCQIDGNADVMRGEEVQAFGALQLGTVAADGLVCHPGTHSKWVRLQDGLIAGVQTMMTGEIFSLLRRDSVLSSQMQNEPAANHSFDEGVDLALNGAHLLSSLFQVRSQYLLSTRELDGASFASGLLIGSDVRAGLAAGHPRDMIAIVGNQQLSTLYLRAFERARFRAHIVNDDDAFVAGMQAIVDHLRVVQENAS